MNYSVLVAGMMVLFLTACVTTPKTDDQSSSLTQTGAMDDSRSSLSGVVLPIETDTVPYANVQSVDIRGYLAKPEGVGPFPGIILIHEWWGLNDQIKQEAEKFAENGYVALAVDMYEGESTTDAARARELSSAVQGDMDSAFSNLEQAVSFLRAKPEVKPDALASVGWCFGGGWAYQMAKNDLGLDATAMYYGRFSPHEDHSHMKTDIIGHFGAEDMSIKVDDVETFQATLSTARGNHEIYIYPGAGHAFANEENESAYNEEAAELAWQRTMRFLRENVE